MLEKTEGVIKKMTIQRNSELATLGTQDTGPRQTKQKKKPPYVNKHNYNVNKYNNWR
jgi:hypothetical protein